MIIGRVKATENSLNAEIRPGDITPIRVMITICVRRSPSCEIVLDRPKKVMPRFFKRLNTVYSSQLRDKVNNGRIVRRSGLYVFSYVRRCLGTILAALPFNERRRLVLSKQSV